jgi:uncharacterized protein YprB with RNaseH-like and TPR domain
MPGRLWPDKEVTALKKAWKSAEEPTMHEFALRYSQEIDRTETGIWNKLLELKRHRKIKDKDKTVPNPHILYFDIETLPLICYTWGIWEQNILTENVIKDWCVLSWSAMWEGDKAVTGDVLTPKEAIARNDQRIVGGMWKLFERADIVISQNGKKFDHKRLNARFIHHKMGMPKPYKVIDTLVEARKIAAFTSNKLDWLAREVASDGRKLETGMELWRACDEGKPDALKKMLDYNMGDVTELRDVYKSLAPYMTTHLNINLFAQVPDNRCRVCSGELTDIGRAITNARKARAWRCVDCGAVGVSRNGV